MATPAKGWVEEGTGAYSRTDGAGVTDVPASLAPVPARDARPMVPKARASLRNLGVARADDGRRRSDWRLRELGRSWACRWREQRERRLRALAAAPPARLLAGLLAPPPPRARQRLPRARTSPGRPARRSRGTSAARCSPARLSAPVAGLGAAVGDGAPRRAEQGRHHLQSGRPRGERSPDPADPRLAHAGGHRRTSSPS